MTGSMVFHFFLLGHILAMLIWNSTSKAVPKFHTPRFSTKTAYRVVTRHGTHNYQKPSKCTAVHVNFVGRHGTRFPSESNVEEFDDLQKTINALIKNNGDLHQSINLQIPWYHTFNIDSSSNITSIGIQELHGIAARLAHTFPELLPINLSSYDSKLYKFSSTCKERSILSAAAARQGMFSVFGEDASKFTQDIPIYQNDCNQDPILRFYKMCPKYEKEVGNDKGTFKELKRFLKGQEMKSVVDNVRRRLGLADEQEITVDRVRTMYTHCAFSVALNMSSGSCSLFSGQDFKVLEYAEDLKYFYEDSTAYDINSKMSCPLLQDIVFDLVASAGKEVNRTKHNIVIRVGHSSTILPLIALMGIEVSPVDLTADNYKRMSGRTFRTSVLAPFASNVAVVLYNCENQEKRIQLYLNEQLVKVPFCSNTQHCLLDDFLAYYRKEVKMCNLSQLCHV